MSVARKLLHRLNGLLPAREDGVVILTYHLVGARTPSPVDLPTAVFAKQVSRLRGLVVSLEDGLTHLATAGRGTRVVLTFDDAFQNFHDVAWPVLLEARVPATLYVPTGFVDRRAPAPLRGGEHLPACTWAQLRDMSATGLLTIGSHTCNHRDLSRSGAEETRSELFASRRRLEEELGRAVTSFCYPGGRVSPPAADAVREVYASAVVRGGRKLHSSAWSPWSLERVPVRNDSPADVIEMIRGPIWLEEWTAALAGRVRDHLKVRERRAETDPRGRGDQARDPH